LRKGSSVGENGEDLGKGGGRKSIFTTGRKRQTLEIEGAFIEGGGGWSHL